MAKTMDKSHALSSPTTVALRLCTFTVVLLFTAAAILAFTGDLVNTLVVLRTQHNLVVTVAGTQAQHVVVPQIDASIGMTVACAAGGCDQRSKFSGPLALLPSPDSLQDVLQASAKLPSLYDDVRHQFVLGYDIGNACGVPTSTVAVLSTLALAAGVIALFFLVAAVVLATLLFILLARRDVLVGISSVNLARRCIIVGKEEILLDVVLGDIHQHLRFERPFLIAVLSSACAALVFAVVAMAVSLALTNSKMKCGHSTCGQFRSAMDAFVEELSAQHMMSTPAPTYDCATGLTVPLFIVVFVLCAVGLVGTVGLGVLGLRGERRRLLLERLRCLTRQHQSLPLLAELEVRQDSCVQPGKATSIRETPSPVSPSFTHASQTLAPALVVERDGPAGSVGDVNHLEDSLRGSPGVEPVVGGPRTLGSGIQLLKQRKLNHVEPGIQPPPRGTPSSPRVSQTGSQRYVRGDLDRLTRPLSRNTSQGDPSVFRNEL